MNDDGERRSDTLFIIERTLSELTKIAQDDQRELLSYLIEIARRQCEEEAGNRPSKDLPLQ